MFLVLNTINLAQLYINEYFIANIIAINYSHAAFNAKYAADIRIYKLLTLLKN
jgi:hypothetical protein